VFSLRSAQAGDAATIRRVILQAQINPLNLNWQRFILAVDERGQVIGCGQIKQHRDGSSELASIAVIPDWQGQGIARRIIEHLLGEHPGTLYLTCRASLGPFYQRFGFWPVQESEMPPYFQRIKRIFTHFQRITRQSEVLLVMRRN
jgi:N-acetylglutamate synthase-like GNAT family acetyltransferase